MKYEWKDIHGDVGKLYILWNRYIRIKIYNDTDESLYHDIDSTTASALYNALGRALAEIDPPLITHTLKDPTIGESEAGLQIVSTPIDSAIIEAVDAFTKLENGNY